MEFDKNNDGKLSAQELPERLEHLLVLGDTNKDGTLDRDEVRKLAATVESFAGLLGPRGPGAGPGPVGRPGFGPGPGRPDDAIQRTLNDLPLTGETKEKATHALRAHQEKLRKFHDTARAELLAEMKKVLSGDDYRAFAAEIDRQPRPPLGPNAGRPGFGRGRPDDLNQRVDQLQKELDELRSRLRK